MSCYVLGLDELDQTQVAVAGGKGAHLGALARIEGIAVPPGFCVTTAAFERIMAEAPSMEERLDRLARLAPDDREAIAAHSGALRRIIEAVAIPDDVTMAITGALARLDDGPWAVRSSATAEDSPGASFAGQLDSYLNVASPAILPYVQRCWASLYTERAVSYRLRQGVDHRKVGMAVVVQQMVVPQAAGILFTADPVTCNRKVSSVEAVFGLGEALVSGRVNADAYAVRDGRIVSRNVASKLVAVVPVPGGGTQQEAIAPARQARPALSDAQVVALAQLGRRIEAHFGCPQDIEWCLVGDRFHIVQSRPITTLFPIPAADDRENRVYVSVGHQQMMTDPMKPLGLSLFQLTSPAPMREAGGRLFVDVTGRLASPATRPGLLELLGRSDPLIADALQTILYRGDFVQERPDDGPAGPPAGGTPAAIEVDADPALVAELIARTQASIAAAKREIATRSGPALLDFILEDIQELRRLLFEPRSLQVIMAAIDASRWLDEQLQAWLGEKSVADALTQSVPHNVTSEMGLALLDVADAIRPHPEVVALLQHVEHDDFLDDLPGLAGGPEARAAIDGFLDRYGMRCVGEIDITRPRFRECPRALVPVILAHIARFEPGEAGRRFEQGRQQAWQKQQAVLARLQALPDGAQKAAETRRMIDLVRTFIGYREYPKYGMVSRYFLYKQALLQEAGRLVQALVLRETEDIFYLTFPELHDVVRTERVDEALIRQRKDAFRSHAALTPPRVLTSDGEIITGAYRRQGVPAGALVGLPVSAGVVEGRARVVLDMADARLEAGDILVTAFTDPSWTPLFVAIDGLVTEVGGLMTHGAVVAREYGVPAVVGVENATRLIRDGQRIRVNGADGYVEILSSGDPPDR